MTRITGILSVLFLPLLASAQGGDQQLRTKADGLFAEQRYAEAMPMYSQLVSLSPSDRDLNYRYGTTILFGGQDKEKAIGHLKYAVDAPSIDPAAWFWMGRAYHLNYRFQEALTAYQRYRGVADKKTLETLPAEALEQQCRNGLRLLSDLKEITVRNKVEVDGAEFFRFYDLSDIGGRIVVTPDELKTALDKKNKFRSLVYLPEAGGDIYFSSYGKDGKTGLDIYRTQLMPDGRFATPVKLAGFINTDMDEDYAVMHPDGKTFYFCSKGHSSMGGYDVFKAMFDQGMDAFGRPENMDFAVNTPDDDIFYMVDAEQKEACFASGRTSKQGMLHVYRVSTAQLPIVITVLKGTFASEFDANDRRAHIVVEDALTREQVADVRTDINGSYVLALPRSGKFRFMVECGPTGKTHSGQVDIPRSDGPRAYRQELSLEKQGDMERLVIRNYFDEPLEGDLIALALDEIRRRARLDVTSTTKPAELPTQEETPGDVLTAAGFDGTVDRESVLRTAEEEAALTAKSAEDMDAMSKAAFALALEAVSEAENAAKQAEALVAKAAGEDNEEKKNATMVEAARLRQVSRDADLRAQAAYTTGTAMDNERTKLRQQSVADEKLAMDLKATLTAQRDKEALPLLLTLKQRLDTRSGPTATQDLGERTRRDLTEREKEAARAMQLANGKRTEVGELTDRMARLEREQQETRSNARQAELGREIAQYEEQLGYLNSETNAAFAKARVLDREAAVLRGELGLTRHLNTATTPKVGTELTDVQMSALGQRISGNRSRIEAIPIDERFDAQIAERASSPESRSFAWEQPASAIGQNSERTATIGMQRDTAADAQRMGGVSTEVERDDAAQRDLASAEKQGGVPAGNNSAVVDGAERTATTTSANDRNGTQRTDAAGVTGQDPSTARSSTVAGGSNATGDRSATVAATRTTDQDAQRMDGAEVGVDAAVAERAAPTNVAVSEVPSEQAGERTQADGIDAQGAATGSVRSTENGAVDGTHETSQAPSETQGSTQTPTTALTPEQVREGDLGNSDGVNTTAAKENVPTTEDEIFMLENEIDELRQMAGAERDRTKRAALEAGIAEREERLALLRTTAETGEGSQEIADAGTEVEDLGPLDRSRNAMVFDATATDEELVKGVYADHAKDMRALQGLTDADERAAGSHGLELMLADSIRAEMARQLAVLELDATQADVILPRVDRLRKLRDARLALADEYLNARQQELLASAQAGAPTTGIENGAGATPIGSDRAIERGEDRFIRIASDPVEIYSSPVEHRSPEVAEALVMKEADLARMEELTTRIDSLQDMINGMGRSRERDRLVKTMARYEDDRMIARTDMGQRSAYLSKAEWATATDSIAALEKSLVRKGLPGAEPLLVMQRDLRTEATERMDRAKGLRKQADRTEDIIMRDSLYRSAYELELRGLREMDQSITVANYLLSDQHVRGESLAYATVAARVLGVPEEDAFAAVPSTRPTTARSDETSSGTETVSETANASGGNSTSEASSTSNSTSDTASSSDVNSASEGVDGIDTRTAGGAEELASSGITVAPVVAATQPPATDAVQREREAAMAQALVAEQALDEKARRPAQLYESYLGNGADATDALDVTEEDDLSALAMQVVTAAEQATELNQRSLQLSDDAAALEDSAATARKRDRSELERSAIRMRSEADSLQRASLLKGEEAQRAELQLAEEREAQTTRKRLLKYYYLTGEEQDLVVDNPDQSRYFQARAKALEQYDAASDASEAARSNRELGTQLRVAAEAPISGNANNTQDAAVRQERIRTLQARSDAFMAKADSLDDVARRLRGAASVNENQAAIMLQGMADEQATSTMAMEMRTRRTEPLLAEARGQAGTQQQAGTQTPGTAGRTGEGSTDTRNSELGDATALVPIEMPAELVEDEFVLRPQGVRDASPIPMDAPIPDGLVFKVQIGAFRSAVPEETFSDMTPVTGERVGNDLVRYTAGLFTSFDQAALAKDKVRDRGYRDAFVVAYRNGVRVPLGVAMREANASQVLASERTATRPMPRSGAEQAVPPTAQGVRGGAGTTTPPTAEGVSVAPQPVTATIEQPTPVVPVPTPEEELAAMLAKYPTSAQAIVEGFAPLAEAASYYNVPGAAPARQVETIKGLFFTVQVGVYSKPVALDKLFNITPLNSELTAAGKIRYTTGVYVDQYQVKARRERAVELGVKDAFVTAYLNGKRIPMREALALLERYGSDILAKP